MKGGPGGGRRSATSPDRIAGIERARKALELRKSGATYQQIADAVGYASPSVAYSAVKSALKRTLQEPADAVRRLELERLDVMLLSVWPKVRQGDVAAIDRALRILERRSRYLGLDAPQRIDLTMTLQRVAQDLGLDPAEVLREAEEVIRVAQSHR